MIMTIAEDLACDVEEKCMYILWDNCAANCVRYDDEINDNSEYFYRTFEFNDGSSIRFEAKKSTDSECRPIPGRYMDILTPRS